MDRSRGYVSVEGLRDEVEDYVSGEEVRDLGGVGSWRVRSGGCWGWRRGRLRIAEERGGERARRFGGPAGEKACLLNGFKL